MKIGVSVFVVATAVSLCFPGLAKPNLCPPPEAQRVEEAIQQVETWPQFATFYAQHGKCDVSALRYAFTQQVAHLAANDLGLLGLSKMLAQHPYLKPKILMHLKSETVPSEDRDKILRVTDACQASQKSLCRDVKKILDP